MRLLVQIFFMAHLFAVHFGAEANQTLSVSAARAEMNWRCRVCAAIPTGVPAMARARHSGTTRVFVHCVLSGSSCCAPEGSPGRGESVGQPAKLSPQTLWREFVGCGCWDRLPDAFKGAGRRCLLPVADKERRPDAMGIGNRRTASRTIAGAVFVCCPHSSGAVNAAQADLCEFREHRSPPIPLIAVGERWEATA